MDRRALLVVSSLTILSCALTGLAWLRPAEAAPVEATASPVVPKVAVVAAAVRDMPVYVRGTGTVQPFQEVTVRSLVDGQIVGVHFEEGQMVKAGDPLYTIDPRPFAHQVELAEANRARDQAQLVAAQAQLVRQASLLKSSFASQQAYETQKATTDQLAASVKADEAAIASARLQLDYATIRAPIGGRVGKRLIDTGNVIHTADDTPLVDLSQIQPIAVGFTVPQENLPDIQREAALGHLAVEARAADDERILAEGELKLIENAIDRTTGTIALKAVFTNDDHQLWPGQFVNARLVLRVHKAAVVVPITSVRPGPVGSVAYVLDAQNRVHVRPVKVAEKAHDLVTILDGVAAGERVVVQHQEGLAEGALVEPQPVGGGS